MFTSYKESEVSKSGVYGPHDSTHTRSRWQSIGMRGLFTRNEQEAMTEQTGFEPLLAKYVLKCDHKEVILSSNAVNVTPNSPATPQSQLAVQLMPSELARLIYRFHIWLVATRLINALPKRKLTRRARKQATLNLIQIYRARGTEVTHRDLRLARLNKGAYILATAPAQVSIDGYKMSLVEIDFDYDNMARMVEATLRLRY